MVELIGYLAALCFALSGVPLAYSAYRAGTCAMSVSGILLVLGGSVGMFAYIALTKPLAPPLLDFALNTGCWSVILRYRLFPKEA